MVGSTPGIKATLVFFLLREYFIKNAIYPHTYLRVKKFFKWHGRIFQRSQRRLRGWKIDKFNALNHNFLWSGVHFISQHVIGKLAISLAKIWTQFVILMYSGVSLLKNTYLEVSLPEGSELQNVSLYIMYSEGISEY